MTATTTTIEIANGVYAIGRGRGILVRAIDGAPHGRGAVAAKDGWALLVGGKAISGWVAMADAQIASLIATGAHEDQRITAASAYLAVEA